MNDVILSIHDLSVNYGGIEAVKGISLDVHEGEIVTLIGANGAGKSSTLRTIAGLVKPSGGTINFRGDNITGRDATTIVKKGITLVPEGRHIFPDLTVLENLKVGAYLRSDDISGDIQWVYDLFPRLRERMKQLFTRETPWEKLDGRGRARRLLRDFYKKRMRKASNLRARTAREAIFEGDAARADREAFADFYDEARYSAHEVDAARADQFKKDLKL